MMVAPLVGRAALTAAKKAAARRKTKREIGRAAAETAPLAAGAATAGLVGAGAAYTDDQRKKSYGDKSREQSEQRQTDTREETKQRPKNTTGSKRRPDEKRAEGGFVRGYGMARGAKKCKIV
jgi:hypothetical protein